jgi:hypothetical protein
MPAAAARSRSRRTAHPRGNRVTLHEVSGFDRAPQPMYCGFTDDHGAELGPPTWSPDGRQVAWAAPEGIWVGTIGDPATCDGWSVKLVVSGGTEPDWGPAEPGPGAAASAPCAPGGRAGRGPGPRARLAQCPPGDPPEGDAAAEREDPPGRREPPHPQPKGARALTVRGASLRGRSPGSAGPTSRLSASAGRSTNRQEASAST